MVRLRTILLAALMLPALARAAQIPGLPSKPTAKTALANPSQTKPSDPLGRETPRGAVMGFLYAAQDENYSLAAQYFQPATGHHRLDPTEEHDLAAQLLAVINQKILASSLESLSNDPEGRLASANPAATYFRSGSCVSMTSTATSSGMSHARLSILFQRFTIRRSFLILKKSFLRTSPDIASSPCRCGSGLPFCSPFHWLY